MLHGKALQERLEMIASSSVGTVLEPMCGPGMLGDVLARRGIPYGGFDLNEQFVQYAKRREHDVWVGDARSPDAYETVDTVILSDTIHHVALEDREQVIGTSASHADKRLIILEPHMDRLKSWIPNVPGAEQLVRAWFDYIERDGVNAARYNNGMSKKELEHQLRNGFGVLPDFKLNSVREIGEDLLAVYDRISDITS
ncbi:MAG: class I SAM-dependent methyltransferase [Candidatus Woesearchaeota archaeon]